MTGGVLCPTIRQATRDDLAGVLSCLAMAFEVYRDQYTPDAYRDTVLTAESADRRLREMTILVAEDKSGEIVGTIACQALDSGEGHLRGMAVIPGFQGKGVAEKLLSAAEAGLRESGCSWVTLDTTSPLERAIRFYTRQGYQPTGTTRDFFGMPVYEYAKNL